MKVLKERQFSSEVKAFSTELDEIVARNVGFQANLNWVGGVFKAE